MGGIFSSGINYQSKKYFYKIITKETENNFIKIQKKEIVTFENKLVEKFGDHILIQHILLIHKKRVKSEEKL